MNRLIFSALLSVIFCACSGPQRPRYADILNPGKLPVQEFVVSNHSDTTVRTAGGASIHIVAGSFDAELVRLSVREALTPGDMVMAGLKTVTADGKPLASGGMIEITAPGQSVAIIKPMEIGIPTNLYDPAMQVFKGKESNDVVAWQDPKPLAVSKAALLGKQLYAQNCASCHAFDKDLTGPALRGFKKRGPWANQNEVYKYIHDAAQYIGCNKYAKELQLKYGAIMQPFPQFTVAQIDAITEYIETDFIPSDTLPGTKTLACYDSCNKYREAVFQLEELKNRSSEIEPEPSQRVDVSVVAPNTPDQPAPRRRSPQQQSPAKTNKPQPSVIVDKVESQNYASQYYNFNIEAFGWYNIDRLLELDGVQDNYLSVRVSSETTNEFNVFLVIPQYNIFQEGGLINDQANLFGFYTKDGKISLPAGTQGIIFALSEKDKKIYFGALEFVTSNKTEVELKLKETDSSEFARMFSELNLKKISIGLNKTSQWEKDSLEIDLEQMRFKLDHLKPKDCDCGCELSDTMRLAAVYSPIDSDYISAEAAVVGGLNDSAGNSKLFKRLFASRGQIPPAP
jgi:mono/diheme cytochrome c family protein